MKSKHWTRFASIALALAMPLGALAPGCATSPDDTSSTGQNVSSSCQDTNRRHGGDDGSGHDGSDDHGHDGSDDHGRDGTDDTNDCLRRGGDRGGDDGAGHDQGDDHGGGGGGGNNGGGGGGRRGGGGDDGPGHH